MTPTASKADSARLNALLVLPNLAQGPFLRRPRAVAACARLDVDRRAYAFLAGLRERYGRGPLRFGTAGLLILHREDVARVLDGSPHPFASDAQAKRRGMAQFQPQAVTVSRGEEWTRRRTLTDSALCAADLKRCAAVATQEATPLLARTTLGWPDFHRAFSRIARRIVLGDRAADDEGLSRMLAGLMSKANRLPRRPAPGEPRLAALLAAYARDAESGGLCAAGGGVEGQLPHWLFALSDTTAMATFRALALLCAHPGADTAGCLEESLRLWPPNPLLLRETVTDVRWGDTDVPAGTQVVIANVLFHRGPGLDRFEPRTPGAFNHFSRGPQACPGDRIAMTVATAVMEVLRPRLRATRTLPDGPLPYHLDVFPLRFHLEVIP